LDGLKSPRRCKIFGQSFYFSSIKKYVVLFGTLFNDIYIIRTNSTTGDETAILRVPLTYGPRDKMIARVEADPDISRPTAITLPTMTFELKRLSYDGNRKLPTINTRVTANSTTADSVNYQYNPVAYNFDFELTILVKNAEDGSKIIEQILPFFTPDWTSTVKLIPEMNVIVDIPVILNNVTLNDVYDGDFKQRRTLTWTLDFTMKGYIYGPVKQHKTIKFANTNFYIANTVNIADAVGNVVSQVFIQTQPGLTANGEPTSNAANSVDPHTILATDDFGYVISVTEET